MEVLINNKKIRVLVTKTNCWEPIGYKSMTNGYYIIKSIPGDTLNHRCFFRYFKYNSSPIPPKMVIMHTCDNRKCCNPDHLILGTTSENNQDCHDKGRSYAKNGFAKIHKEKLSNSAKKRVQKDLHTCAFCGTKYEARSWNSRYCNDCKIKPKPKNLIKDLRYSKKCIKCNQDFLGNSSTAKICYRCKGEIE